MHVRIKEIKKKKKKKEEKKKIPNTKKGWWNGSRCRPWYNKQTKSGPVK
jgi:hypothetical protein